jgi:metallo-beta-lactamase family protein
VDWHNDVSRLILDINEALLASPDEKTRGVLIRRLQRALENDDGAKQSPATDLGSRHRGQRKTKTTPV